MRKTLVAGTASVVLGLGLAIAPASSAQAAKPDLACLKAGINTLRSAGLLGSVAANGLPISTAVALGVTPREGTDLSAVPDPIPLYLLLADHKAGDNSLFIYPWCDNGGGVSVR